MRGHCGLSAGGQPRHSLHLTALVQLVKEIPEFLFGEVKGSMDSPESESRGASLDGERASPEGKSDSRASARSLLCTPHDGAQVHGTALHVGSQAQAGRQSHLLFLTARPCAAL